MLIDSKPSLIIDKNNIENVLLTKFDEESMIEYKRTQIKEFILQFNESQYPNRATCEKYTGVDRMPCYDRDSCLKSCYSVPVCSLVKSEPFIFTIRDWNIARLKVNKSLMEVLEKWENAKTQSDYSSLKSSINVLKNDMEDMEENGLYSVYGFCKDMDISYDSLDSAKSIISLIETTVSSKNSIKQKATNMYDLTTERVNFIKTRPALYTDIHLKVSDSFDDCEDNYRNSKVYDESIEIKLANASTYINSMLKLKNEGNYKLAIEKGNDYYSVLQTLRVNINSLVVRRKEVDHEANKVLETYNKSFPILTKTKYDTNITLIKNEVTKILNMRIVSSELTNTKANMIFYDELLKEMVSDCVLNKCEKNEDEIEQNETEQEQNETIDDTNETEVPNENNNEKEVSFITSIINSITSIINNIVTTISSLFGN